MRNNLFSCAFILHFTQVGLSLQTASTLPLRRSRVIASADGVASTMRWHWPLRRAARRHNAACERIEGRTMEAAI